MKLFGNELHFNLDHKSDFLFLSSFRLDIKKQIICLKTVREDRSVTPFPLILLRARFSHTTRQDSLCHQTSVDSGFVLFVGHCLNDTTPNASLQFFYYTDYNVNRQQRRNTTLGWYYKGLYVVSS